MDYNPTLAVGTTAFRYSMNIWHSRLQLHSASMNIWHSRLQLHSLALSTTIASMKSKVTERGSKKEEKGADKEGGECCAHRAATDHRLAQRHNTNTDRSLRLPDLWQPSWSRHLPLKEPTRLFSFFGRPEIGNRKQFKSTHNIAGPSHFHLVIKQGNYTINKIWKGK